DWPGQSEVTAGLGDGACAIGHRAPRRGPQPARGAHPGGDLRDLLGERTPTAGGGTADPATFEPLDADLATTVVQVAGAGRDQLFYPCGRRPAARAYSSGRI